MPVVLSIPVPLVFGKGQFESGVAAMMLREFAHDPFAYLDEAEIRKDFPPMHAEFLTQRRKDAKAQRGRPQPKKNRRQNHGRTESYISGYNPCNSDL